MEELAEEAGDTDDDTDDDCGFDGARVSAAGKFVEQLEAAAEGYAQGGRARAAGSGLTNCGGGPESMANHAANGINTIAPIAAHLAIFFNFSLLFTDSWHPKPASRPCWTANNCFPPSYN